MYETTKQHSHRKHPFHGKILNVLKEEKSSTHYSRQRNTKTPPTQQEKTVRQGFKSALKGSIHSGKARVVCTWQIGTAGQRLWWDGTEQFTLTLRKVKITLADWQPWLAVLSCSVNGSLDVGSFMCISTINRWNWAQKNSFSTFNQGCSLEHFLPNVKWRTF